MVLKLIFNGFDSGQISAIFEHLIVVLVFYDFVRLEAPNQDVCKNKQELHLWRFCLNLGL